MSKINTNMAGVTTLYHLRNKEDAMNQALERISSGLRINNAVDDAAGASLVNRMTSQVKGLEAAIRNAADAVSLTQTAEGALDEVSSILHRMRELAVQAANGVYTGQDRQAIQNEVGQLQLELARIAENSTFNAVKMLNGDFTNTAFQIGFQPGDSAILSIENVDPTGLGEYLVATDQLKNSSSTFFPAAFPSVANNKAGLTSKVVESEDLTIYGNVGNATIDINGGANAKEIAAAITARKGETGVYADAQTRMNVTFSELTSASPDTVSFNLYGKNDTAVLIAANVDFGVTDGASANLSELAAAVNGTSGKTGITASLSIDKSTMTLISDDGYDIVVEDYQLVAGSGPRMQISGADENYDNLTDGTSVFNDKNGAATTTSRRAWARSRRQRVAGHANVSRKLAQFFHRVPLHRCAGYSILFTKFRRRSLPTNYRGLRYHFFISGTHALPNDAGCPRSTPRRCGLCQRRQVDDILCPCPRRNQTRDHADVPEFRPVRALWFDRTRLGHNAPSTRTVRPPRLGRARGGRLCSNKDTR